MRTMRWLALGFFLVVLLFLSLLEEKAITQAAYRQSALIQELRNLRDSNSDLKARLEKTVNYAALMQWARKLHLAPPEDGTR